MSDAVRNYFIGGSTVLKYMFKIDIFQSGTGGEGQNSILVDSQRLQNN